MWVKNVIKKGEKKESNIYIILFLMRCFQQPLARLRQYVHKLQIQDHWIINNQTPFRPTQETSTYSSVSIHHSVLHKRPAVTVQAGIRHSISHTGDQYSDLCYDTWKYIKADVANTVAAAFKFMFTSVPTTLQLRFMFASVPTPLQLRFMFASVVATLQPTFMFASV